jgi:hypothetical protein
LSVISSRKKIVSEYRRIYMTVAGGFELKIAFKEQGLTPALV